LFSCSSLLCSVAVVAKLSDLVSIKKDQQKIKNDDQKIVFML